MLMDFFAEGRNAEGMQMEMVELVKEGESWSGGEGWVVRCGTNQFIWLDLCPHFLSIFIPQNDHKVSKISPKEKSNIAFAPLHKYCSLQFWLSTFSPLFFLPPLWSVLHFLLKSIKISKEPNFGFALLFLRSLSLSLSSSVEMTVFLLVGFLSSWFFFHNCGLKVEVGILKFASLNWSCACWVLLCGGCVAVETMNARFPLILWWVLLTFML